MTTTEKIQNLVDSKKIFLFMKGDPYAPACGFSARAINLLRANSVDIDTIGYFNVLEDEEIRNGIKVFSSWPTIPQLYVDGVFIGGSDIMLEMHEDGELAKVLD
jgi:monothiol glutaredoxin